MLKISAFDLVWIKSYVCNYMHLGWVAYSLGGRSNINYETPCIRRSVMFSKRMHWAHLCMWNCKLNSSFNFEFRKYMIMIYFLEHEKIYKVLYDHWLPKFKIEENINLTILRAIRCQVDSFVIRLEWIELGREISDIFDQKFYFILQNWIYYGKI